ncbi:MAG TPA: dihydrodipicolinate synthase family protein, partial [Pilimelia sp.]|nr:dihydrodipicolinate synthase family protein [Pilimelia sp.]
MRLHGLLSFPLTPFTSNDNVDLEVLAEHVDRQIAAGPSALFVACGTGEFTALNLHEYRDVVSTAVRVAGGRLPVFAGTGGGPQLAREFAAAAAASGADGLL